MYQTLVVIFLNVISFTFINFDINHTLYHTYIQSISFLRVTFIKILYEIHIDIE